MILPSRGMEPVPSSHQAEAIWRFWASVYWDADVYGIPHWKQHYMRHKWWVYPI